ncbi:MAG: ABC transporter permease, partial [Gammaproteobacteria bacterium]
MKAGSLRVLFAAVLLAVTALAAVGFFTDRVERALQGERAAALAADLVTEQGEPIPEAWLAKARSLGLTTSRQVGFPSVLFLQGQPRLVQVKAVDAGYPLRGRLRIERPDGTESGEPPRPGEAVVEARIARWLGEQTAVPLGRVKLHLAGRLLEEPDVGANLFRLAPRLLINRADLNASGLLGP